MNSENYHHPYRPDGNFRAAVDEVVERNTEQARETFVDDFHGGHAPAHDTFLRCHVVRAYTSLGRIRFGFFGFARDAAQQRVYFVLGEKFLAHGIK